MKSEAKTIRLLLDGMTCINCQNRIQQRLSATKGVLDVKVSYRAGTADIVYHPSAVSLQTITAVIENLGYRISNGKPAYSLQKTAGFLLLILSLFALLSHFGILNLLVPSQLADSTMGYGMLFVIGLITSVHCIAMCGGINLSQCLPSENRDTCQTSRVTALRPALLYNIGRVISYTVIGFFLGLAGMLLSTGTDAGISTLLQGILKIIAGVFMVIMGLNMLGLFPSLRRFNIRMPKAFTRKVNRAKARNNRPLVVGLLNGLMPCGPLQSMQIIALASGNPITGACSMLLFSLGTVPLMLGFGSLVSLLGRRFTRIVTEVGAVLVVVLGLAMLAQGGNLSGFFTWTNLLAIVLALSLVGMVAALPYKKKVQRVACVALSACICGAVLLYASIGSPAVGSTEITEGTAEVTDGVQIVRSTLQPGDYPDITVQVGLPVKWIIDAPEGSINGCNYKVLLQKYDIEYTFQTGENVIEFTPEETGTFSYSCWMGMIYGSITVTSASDSPENTAKTSDNPAFNSQSAVQETAAFPAVPASNSYTTASSLEDNTISYDAVNNFCCSSDDAADNTCCDSTYNTANNFCCDTTSYDSVDNFCCDENYDDMDCFCCE